MHETFILYLKIVTFTLIDYHMNRITAYLFGCIILILSFFIYEMYIADLGFPDGFTTELEEAQKKLFTTFIYISIILSLYFFYLGWISAQKKITKKLYITISIYIIFLIIVFIINYYLRFHFGLMDGGGG